MNFSSLKKAVGKAYETAASTAGTVAKDIQSQVGSFPLLISLLYISQNRRHEKHHKLPFSRRHLSLPFFGIDL